MNQYSQVFFVSIVLLNVVLGVERVYADDADEKARYNDIQATIDRINVLTATEKPKEIQAEVKNVAMPAVVKEVSLPANKIAPVAAPIIVQEKPRASVETIDMPKIQHRLESRRNVGLDKPVVTQEVKAVETKVMKSAEDASLEEKIRRRRQQYLEMHGKDSSNGTH